MTIAQVSQQKANHHRDTDEQNTIRVYYTLHTNHVNVNLRLMTSVNKQTKT